MGIYHDGIIFGIKYGNEESGTLFEETFDTEMNKEQVESFKEKYIELSNKDDYYFHVYMATQDTYSREPSPIHMYWWPIRKEALIKWINHDEEYKRDL